MLCICVIKRLKKKLAHINAKRLLTFFELAVITAQKMKSSIKDFFSKCD